MSAVIQPRPRFHSLATAILAAAVVAGFARTYYLRFLSDLPPMSFAVHVHGIISTLWIALHFTQARLIAVRNVALHKKLGMVTALVGFLLIYQGAELALESAARGHAPNGRDPLQFLAISMASVVMFAVFLVLALALRTRKEWHKRLMLLATMVMILPAIGRLDTWIMQWAPHPRAVVPFLTTCAFIVWAALNDWRRSGRVHPAYYLGGTALAVSIPLRHAIGGTDAWMAFARWATS
jgi:hypothetical protein